MELTNDLFHNTGTVKQENIPLAVRMRPRTLAEFYGQNHILGKGKLLRRLIETDRITSLIFYGPPGTGKTTLAYIIASKTNSRFERLSAVGSTVADIRKVISKARNRLQSAGANTILFIDEIHRFNKAQQDVLLPDIENRTIQLIGATTHNPFFSVIGPLISRSHIFQFEPLKEEEIIKILHQAIQDEERGLGKSKLNITDEAIRLWARLCDGDARKALNALEIAALSTPPMEDGKIYIGIEVAAECFQRKPVLYDRDGDQHYDTISAYIKSMRGSDPDAALYWLAKMLAAGEDPAYIARRLVICASEDVGNAEPQALVIATSALQAVESIGMPEAMIPLAQATIFVASAPKSNSSYLAIKQAMDDIEREKTLEVPDALKDTHYKGAKLLGHGKGYKYSHNGKDHYIQQDFLPEKKKYYIPTDMGYERKIKRWLEYLRENAERHNSQ